VIAIGRALDLLAATFDVLTSARHRVAASEECDDGANVDGDGCSAECVVECSGDKEPTTFHCYVVQTTMVSWDSAHAGCLALGSGWDLAAINSIAERDWVDANSIASVTFTWIGGRDVPANLWVRCGNERCKELIYTREFEKNLRVCQKCQFHARLPATVSDAARHPYRPV